MLSFLMLLMAERHPMNQLRFVVYSVVYGVYILCRVGLKHIISFLPLNTKNPPTKRFVYKNDLYRSPLYISFKLLSSLNFEPWIWQLPCPSGWGPRKSAWWTTFALPYPTLASTHDELMLSWRQHDAKELAVFFRWFFFFEQDRI